MNRSQRTLLALGSALLLMLGFARAQERGVRRSIGLTAGWGLSMAQGSARHAESWSAGLLAGTAVENTLSLESRGAVFMGGTFTRLGRAGLGWQAGFGYLKSALDAADVFTRSGPSGQSSRTIGEGAGRAEITAVPLYFNLAFGWDLGGGWAAVFSAGPALVLHSVLAEPGAGILLPAEGTSAFRVQAGVADQIWIAPGADFGAALELRAGPSLDVSLELRWFLSPAKSFSWTWTAGTAVGLDDPAARAVFEEAAALAAERNSRPVSLSPSFVQVSAGIRFRLPDSFSRGRRAIIEKN